MLALLLFLQVANPSTIELRDEGTTQGRVRVLNCTGAGVACSAAAGVGTVNASGGGGSFAATETEVDFGTAIPYPSVRIVTVVDAGVTAASKILVTQSGNAATGRQADEAEMDFLVCNAKPASGSFQLTCLSVNGPVAGKYKIIYAVG